ncbi:thymidylate synthase [Streptomyces aurantiacus]|uniref:thymidylate synthase n=1 Tax=Streptomyces aurantiacus TaxID=47760 RepID=UPI0027914BBB|nr:thymidylate synthase [Streptomyces aurantiacus]MDQ0778376.1 thymidylate synthase [Streptomyces aurantiacus]
MLAPPVYPGFEQAYVDVLGHVVRNHQYRNVPRGNAARECLGLSFQLTDPRERLPYLAARRVNPIFHFAEALWYLAGRDDLDMIAYYAPHMGSDSRDGTTINGSAYGSRIFNPTGGDTVSPFDRVLELLRTEADSKRGLLPIFETRELTFTDNPDVSCAVALHLLVRERRLHMITYMRANDCDRGLLADVFSFTMIQEFAAVQLGLKLGTYTHHIGSAHIGDRDFDRVQRVLAEAEDTRRSSSPRFPFPPMPDDTTAETIATVLKHEEALRTNQVQYRPADVAGLSLPPYWQQVLLLFEVKRELVHCPADPVEPDILASLDAGSRWQLAHRWPSRMPRGFEPAR